MDLQLFKTGLRMFLRSLVMILWPNKGFGKWAKKEGGPLTKKTSQFSIFDKSADMADINDRRVMGGVCRLF